MVFSSIYAILLVAGLSSIASARPTFKGNFVLSKLLIQSSFQARPNSTDNSAISFTFLDEDQPHAAPVRCSVEWPVGLSPPSLIGGRHCEDPSVGVWFPESTYYGVQNFTIAFSHTYEDDSVGPFPYNRLTKFAEVNMTYPGTKYYECDVAKASCNSCAGTSIIAKVTRAIA